MREREQRTFVVVTLKKKRKERGEERERGNKYVNLGEKMYDNGREAMSRNFKAFVF